MTSPCAQKRQGEYKSSHLNFKIVASYCAARLLLIKRSALLYHIGITKTCMFFCRLIPIIERLCVRTRTDNMRIRWLMKCCASMRRRYGYACTAWKIRNGSAEVSCCERYSRMYHRLAMITKVFMSAKTRVRTYGYQSSRKKRLVVSSLRLLSAYDNYCCILCNIFLLCPLR